MNQKKKTVVCRNLVCCHFTSLFSCPSHTMNGMDSKLLIKNNVGVISCKFINKLVQKCQCYYSFSDQSIPLVTVTSVVSLLTEQL